MPNPRQVIQDSGSLKVMLSEKGYDMLCELRDKVIRRWNDQTVSGQDAFQTLRAVHRKEGKVEGLVEFFETLEKEALK